MSHIVFNIEKRRPGCVLLQAAMGGDCDVCNDTRQMVLHTEDEEDYVMCTHCPTPCQKCRAGGNGPFCEKTPCRCTCHT